jgi:hypothetical protein
MSLLSGTAALRCYVSYHPNAHINLITYNGRTVWMTQKQYGIWRVVLNYKMRGKWTTLDMIAARASRFGPKVSVATVSRFLRRLDLWRFIDLVTLSGRRGGTVILTRRAKTADREAWLAGARITYASRKKARDIMLRRVRRLWDDFFRGPTTPKSVPTGSTGAKYRSLWGQEGA